MGDFVREALRSKKAKHFAWGAQLEINPRTLLLPLDR